MSERFRPGERVRVLALHPPGHCRTPFYTRGRTGTVLGVAARLPSPEELAYGRPGLPVEPVYRVAFEAGELWPGQAGADRVIVDLAEPWLQPAPEERS